MAKYRRGLSDEERNLPLAGDSEIESPPIPLPPSSLREWVTVMRFIAVVLALLSVGFAIYLYAGNQRDLASPLIITAGAVWSLLIVLFACKGADVLADVADRLKR